MAFKLNNLQPKAYTGGKLIAVDPNPKGEDDEQAFQPQEDYNIIVELTTYRKRKTKIVLDEDNDELNVRGRDFTGDQESLDDRVRINFLEGSEVGGEQKLTTHYTELRTRFEDEQEDLETLGITNINIEFNTSFAPLITINFTDVRARMFERGNDSKYNIFFNLPYPIFALTIKGYYGPPVTYCLHLTKFKSKFNSDTGNMEITTNFVGYTYAFLADMLLGYVRAIGETDCGQDKLNEKRLNFSIARNDSDSFERNDQRVPITINDFLKRTQSINKYIDKVKSGDEQLKEYIAANSLIDNISGIEDDVLNLRSRLNGSNLNSDTLVINNGGVMVLPTGKEQISVDEEDGDLIVNIGENPVKVEESYNSLVEEINSLNENLDKDYKINTDDIKIRVIKDNIGSILSRVESTDSQNYIEDVLDDEFNIDEGSDNNELNKNIVLVDTKVLSDRLQATKKQLQKDTKNGLESLSKRISDKISDEDLLGFRPTIANIIEIFTHNIEAFMQCIHGIDESIRDKIENNDNIEDAQLKGNAQDRNVLENLKDRAKEIDVLGDTETPNIFPFPEYRVKNEATNGAFEEAWIGDVAPDIEEVGFVEDLIDGLLETKKRDNNRARGVQEQESAWVPIHPYDLKGVVYDTNPWSFNFTSGDQIIELLAERASIFLHGGYNSGGLGGTDLGISNNEISTTAKLEANNLFSNLDDDKLKRIVENTSVEDITERIRELGLSDERVYARRLSLDEDPLSDTLHITDNDDEFSVGGDIKIYTRSDYNNEIINNILPSYIDEDLNESMEGSSEILGRTGDNNGYESLIDTSGDGSNTNEVRNTKFVGNLGHTDYTTIAKKFDVGRGDVMPTYIAFYGEGSTSNLPLPFTSDRRAISFENMVGSVVDESIDLSDNNTFNPDTRLIQEEILNNSRSFSENDVDEGLDTTRDIEEPIVGNIRGIKAGEVEKNLIIGDSAISIPFLGFSDNSFDRGTYYNIFGTQMYYEQTSEEARAFLFLSSIPFKGYTFPTSEEEDGGRRPEGLGDRVLGNNVLRQLFNLRSAFVSVPYSWMLYIGSLIWRYEQDQDPIKFKKSSEQSGNEYALSPIMGRGDGTRYFNNLSNDSNSNTKIITTYFGRSVEFDDWGTNITLDYDDLDLFEFDYDLIPFNVRNRLRDMFIRWVRDNSTDIGWSSIKNNFEIFDTDNVTSQDILEFWRDGVDMDSNGIRIRNDVLFEPGSGYDNVVNYDVIRNTYGTPNGDSTVSLIGVDTGLKVISDSLDLGTSIIDTINGTMNINDYEDELGDAGLGTTINFFLEINDASEGSSFLRRFINEERIISNPMPYIFEAGERSSSIFGESSFFETDTNELGAEETLYFNSFLEEFRSLISEDNQNISTEQQQLKRDIFRSLDNEDIKLTVYKDIKNIYDKWVAGTDNPMSVCGPNYASDDGNQNLFDSFRFLDRSFDDISDELLINPLNIVSYLNQNYNKSFYNFLSRILSDNNMDFIPLPNFVDFSDPNELERVFTPKLYAETSPFDETNSGPSFVCMYIGERANTLDLGDSSDYEDKGFDVKLEKPDAGNNEKGDDQDPVVVTDPEVPDLLGDTSDNQSKVPIFMVNYGDQNQSIFKDFDLDQSEFSETNESLIVQEQISQRGSPSSQNMQGQNLYNIYEKRAYHCEIEALGTAYIQPLMYFQLNNVPMFHGVYTIINVSHSIQPNHMTTRFKGVRVGRIRTPFVESETVFMNLVGSLSDLELDNEDIVVGRNLNNEVPEIVNAVDSEDAAPEIIVDVLGN